DCRRPDLPLRRCRGGAAGGAGTGVGESEGRAMTQALWTADEVAAATNGKAARGFAATGVSIDSRSVDRGDLFVALQGPTFDGHDFVASALAHGAAGALIHRRPKDLPADAPVIEVADTMRGLEDLGRAARARTEARVAAV